MIFSILESKSKRARSRSVKDGIGKLFSGRENTACCIRESRSPVEWKNIISHPLDSSGVDPSELSDLGLFVTVAFLAGSWSSSLLNRNVL